MRHTITDSTADNLKSAGDLVTSTDLVAYVPDEIDTVTAEGGVIMKRIPVMIYSPNLKFSDTGGLPGLFFKEFTTDTEGYTSYIDLSNFTKIYDLSVLVKPYYVGQPNAVKIDSGIEDDDTDQRAVAEAVENVKYVVALKDLSSLIRGVFGQDVLRTVDTNLCHIGIPVSGGFTEEINGTSIKAQAPVKYINAFNMI